MTMRCFGSKGDPAAGPETPAVEGASPSPAAERRSRRKRIAFSCLHVMLVALTVVGLTLLNQLWGLDRLLNVHWQTLRAVWLPLLFLLAYILCRLSWWAVCQLGPDPLSGEFPDVERAWGAARQMLASQGIDLRTTPLFLVLGQPEGGIEMFFAASHWPFQVRFAPPVRDPSLHVYANREAVFVVCGSASLLTATAQRRSADDAEGRRAAPPPCLLPEVSPDATDKLADDEASVPVPRTSAQATAAAAAAPALPRACLIGEEKALEPQPQASLWPAQDPELTDRLAARLRCLCHCVARDREPLVPINGILVLYPFWATDHLHSTRAVAQACRKDLREVRQSLGTECPVMTLLCDMQRLPGFEAVVAAFPDNSTQQWVLGRDFPLVPDIEPARWPGMVEQGIRWLADVLWPSVIYPLLQPGTGQWSDTDSILQANQQRFQLLQEGWERLKLLPELVVRSLQNAPPARPLLGGVGLAATGPDGLRQQAFAAGMLRWLVEAQDQVGWTDEALREDALCRRWTFWGGLGLAGFLLTLVTLSLGFLR